MRTDDGWTVGTLKAHLEALFTSRELRYTERHLALEAWLRSSETAAKDALAAALLATERAVTKAEQASEKRFDAVNEFREALGDQQRTLMPRAEAESRIEAMAEKIAVLAAQVQGLAAERRGSQQLTQQAGPYLVGLIAAILAVYLHFAH